MSRKNCIIILIFVKSFNSFATKVRRNFGEMVNGYKIEALNEGIEATMYVTKGLVVFIFLRKRKIDIKGYYCCN